MQENNLKEKTIKRPWQSYVWVFLNIFYFILLIYVIIFATSQYPQADDWLVSFTPIMMIITTKIEDFLYILFDHDIINFIPGDIGYFLIYNSFRFFINLFFISGFISGSRFIVKTVLTLSILRIIFYFIFFLRIIFYFTFFYGTTLLFFQIPFFILMLFLELFCLDHPFYNQKKVDREI